MVRSDMLPQPDRGLGLDRPQTEAFHRRVQEEDSRSPQRRKAQARGHGRVRPRQEHRGEAGQVDKRDRLAARRRQPHARVEPDPGARAREPQAPDGGRRLKTSGASIRSEVRAMAANGGGRCPISAQRWHRGLLTCVKISDTHARAIKRPEAWPRAWARFSRRRPPWPRPAPCSRSSSGAFGGCSTPR